MRPHGESTTFSYLEALPLETVEVISQYLTAKDIASCCATSRRLREVFGSNRIWRKRCEKRLTKYLRRTPCRVEPHFCSPEASNSTLSPVSQWRLAYMMQNHLWNNWRSGRYVEEDLFKTTGMFRSPLRITFLNEDCIIVMFHDKLEFLNVRESPPTKAAEPIKLTIMFNHHRKIIAKHERIIIVFYTFVQVYKIDLSSKETIPLHVFFFDDSTKLTNIKGEEDLEVTRLNIFRNKHKRKARHFVAGCYFVGVRHGESTIHIWNYVTGVKLKEQECIIENFWVEEMKGYTEFILVMRNHSNLTCLAYDLNSLTYLPFNVPLGEFFGASFVDRYVAILSSIDKFNLDRVKYFDVYNLKTSKHVLRRQMIQSHCESFGNNFVFIQNYKLKVFSPFSNTLEGLCLNTDGWFKVISRRFVLVRRFYTLLKVYDFQDSFRDTKMMMSNNEAVNLSVNKTCTRTINGKAVLHTFW